MTDTAAPAPAHAVTFAPADPLVRNRLTRAEELKAGMYAKEHYDNTAPRAIEDLVKAMFEDIGLAMSVRQMRTLLRDLGFAPPASASPASYESLAARVAELEKQMAIVYREVNAP